MGAVSNLHLFYSSFQSFAVSKLISDHVCLICVQDCHQKENDQTPRCCNHSDCFDRLLFFRDVTSHLLCVHPLKWGINVLRSPGNIFVIQRLPGSSTQPAARNKLMVLSPVLQNSILPVAAPAKSFEFAHPFTHYTICASITSGGGDLV